MTKLGIVGQGFVGSALREVMGRCFEIFAYDKDSQKYRNADSIKEVVEKSEVTFLCVPTPMHKDGSCDLRIVRCALGEIQQSAINLNKSPHLVVIKSTVPPGTTDKLSVEFSKLEIVFNPEFLTEANYLDDFRNQNRIVIGGNSNGCAKVNQIFNKAFPKVPIIKTSATVAEMIKYCTNSFLAMKVSYANEIYQLCKALNIDYDKVVEYAKYDDRLGYSHWSVPGPDGDFGFGGHCFPKDISALKFIATQIGVDTTMLNATITKNDQVRTDKNWERQVGRAVSDD